MTIYDRCQREKVYWKKKYKRRNGRELNVSNIIVIILVATYSLKHEQLIPRIYLYNSLIKIAVWSIVIIIALISKLNYCKNISENTGYQECVHLIKKGNIKPKLIRLKNLEIKKGQLQTNSSGRTPCSR